ncbi:MAG: hypothetical protein CMK64_05225 [Pseudoalteromonas sp.]|nr:hypothetical protein [Pseudoalteromonas sp.]|tara:strand:- start:51749 stop:51964 length:216 start_codon:yes stop_codon:yes gene_type:complete
MKWLPMILVFFLIGCKTIKEDEHFLHYSEGAQSIDAFSSNPLLKCKKRPRYARLDKKYDERVFIVDGEKCK